MKETIKNEFDAVFYLAAYPDVRDAGADPLAHYNEIGWKEGYDPNPVFSTRHYLAGNPDVAARNTNPFQHFLKSGRRQGRPSVAPIFDREYYVAHNPDVAASAVDPVEHYFSRGRYEGRQPNALFDVAHYRVQLKGSPAHGDDFLLHYLTIGWRRGLSPHPLFDHDFYQRQLAESDRTIPPLTHYLKIGWRLGLSPHPLFDPDYYTRFSEPPVKNRNPLVAYVMSSSANGVPHYLFSDSYYLAEAKRKFEQDPQRKYTSGPALLHYIKYGADCGVNPHPLFDSAVYAKEIKKRTAAIDEVGSVQSRQIKNPLLHYVEIGASLGVSPTPYFQADFYRRQFKKEIMGDPLRHYLLPEGFSKASPHPGIDLDHYASHAFEFFPGSTPSILHLLATEKSARISPHAWFDPNYYSSANDDIKTNDLCPILHFLAHGMREGRSPNAYFSEDYVLDEWPERSFVDESEVEFYFKQQLDRRIRIIFVSHDASQTGAPAIILRLLQEFSGLSNVECFCILDRGGPRLEEFKRFSHVHVMPRSLWEVGEGAAETASEVAAVLGVTGVNGPAAALVNSVESRHIGAALRKNEIPVISLVHEMAQFYPTSTIQRLYRISSKVVFPSQFVADNADASVPIPEGLSVVRGQGLLRDRFGKMDRTNARRRVAAELRLPNDTFLVLACGTIDQRKGVDYFVTTAIRFLKTKPADRPTCFIWIGEGLHENTSPQFYAANEVKMQGMEREIRFIGSRSDVEPYFVASDAFLLPSRADPFPCVVQEAMASSLPVIAFNDGGGAPELISPNAGFCVPFGDTEAMAGRLLELFEDESLRRELGDNASRKIRENCGFDEYFSFFRDLIADLAEVQPSVMGDARSPTAGDGKRVFFLSHDWSLSGVNAATESLVNQLNRRGFRAEIVFTRGRFSSIPEIKGNHVLPSVPHRFVQPQKVPYQDGEFRTTPEQVWKSLKRLLDQNRPCIVVPNYDYVASAITPFLPDDVAVVGQAHSDHIEHYEHIYRLGRNWNRVVPVSERIADKIVADNASLSDRIAIIRYGVAHPRLTAQAIAAAKAKAKDPLTLIYTGRLVTEQKNIYEYVELTRVLHDLGVDFKLIICGDGPEYTQLSAQLARLIASGRVELTGRISPAEIGPLLSKADVFVLLSDYEGLPVGMLEAMAHACVPVVYHVESGIPEVIQQGKNGFVVPGGDLRGVVERIRWLSANPKRRIAMARMAHKSIADLKLTEDDMGGAYAKLFEEVLSEISRGVFTRDNIDIGAQQYNTIAPPPVTFGLEPPHVLWARQALR